MDEFLLLVKGDDDAEVSPEVLQQRMANYMVWMQEMTSKGNYVDGRPLQKEGHHIINKDTVLTDGPFLETKEVIGGYIIIKANDINEATSLAKTCPFLNHCEIFVRPVMRMDH